MDNSVGVEAESIPPLGPDAAGRVGSLFCQLHASRFCGEVYVESGERQLTLVFHGGNPVFAEDVSGGGSLSQEFVTRELISSAAFVELTTQDFEAAGSCLDMGLCARAVETGNVSAAAASELAMRWVRTHLMAAMNWEDCHVDLDDTVVVPASLHSWAQPLGPLVYLGVRTFYGQETIDQMFRDDRQGSIEFLAPVEAAVEFFEMEEEERRLLEACAPRMDIPGILRLSELDELHTWQLLALLRLAGLVEVAAFAEFTSAVADPSALAWVPPSLSSPSSTSAPPADPQSTPGAEVAPAGGYRQRSGGSGAKPREAAPYSSTARRPERPRAAVPARRPPRQEAVARLNKELERRRPASKSVNHRADAAASSRSAPPPTAPRSPGRAAGGDYLKDLVRRRMAQSQAGAGARSESLDAVACLTRGQAELRKQAFDKAAVHLAKAVAADPDSEIFQAYHLWAEFRAASRPDAERMTRLRGLLGPLVSSEDHKAFALHALGHLAFTEGQDAKAERWLRKAMEANPKNRDAERYLRVLETRSGAKASGKASGAGEPQKIFGIELGTRVGKK